jgi:hypothetical protein
MVSLLAFGLKKDSRVDLRSSSVGNLIGLREAKSEKGWVVLAIWRLVLGECRKPTYDNINTSTRSSKDHSDQTKTSSDEKVSSAPASSPLDFSTQAYKMDCTYPRRATPIFEQLFPRSNPTTEAYTVSNRKP